jgi:hypothetical protein
VQEITIDGETVFEPRIDATGGDNVFDITQNGVDFRVHEFTTVGTANLSINSGSDELQFLVIAGGGGTGGRFGGGGGAGGYISSVPGELSGRKTSPVSTITASAGENFTVTVGDGGNGSIGDNDNQTSGENSVLSGPNDTITAIGGGHGGGENITGDDGGSGGGSRGGRSHPPGQGTAGQGFDAFTRDSNENGEGGGGGAGGEGTINDSFGNTGQVGGPGITSSITGTSIERAKGGDVPGPDGAANTGNGGGGSLSESSSAVGEDGGSGIVIIRYKI